MSYELIQNNEEIYKKQLQIEFNKSLHNVDEYIDILRTWADIQPHFPEKPTYKTLRFLVLSNKFSIEKAKQKLDMYYTIRNLIPEIFTLTPFHPDVVLHNKIWYLVPLPKVMEDHSRILYHRLNPDYEGSKFDAEKMVVQIIHVVEILIQEDLSFNCHYIFDCAGLTTAHAANTRPVVMKKGSAILEGSVNINGRKLPWILIGDPAYPLFPWLLKGFSGPNLTSVEDLFNVHLNSARVAVEIAFGRLKSRWRCVLKRLDVHYSFVPNIVATCCVLHNIVETYKENFDTNWLKAVEEAEKTFKQLVKQRNMTRDNLEGYNLRVFLAEYLANNFTLRSSVTA